MLRLRSISGVFAPVLACYFVLFGVLLVHPAAHNVLSDVLKGRDVHNFIVYDAPDQSEEGQSKSEFRGDFKEREIGECLVCNILITKFSDTAYNDCFITLKPAGAPVHGYNSIISSALITASWSERAPPAVA